MLWATFSCCWGWECHFLLLRIKPEPLHTMHTYLQPLSHFLSPNTITFKSSLKSLENFCVLAVLLGLLVLCRRIPPVLHYVWCTSSLCLVQHENVECESSFVQTNLCWTVLYMCANSTKRLLSLCSCFKHC